MDMQIAKGRIEYIWTWRYGQLGRYGKMALVFLKNGFTGSQYFKTIINNVSKEKCVKLYSHTDGCYSEHLRYSIISLWNVLFLQWPNCYEFHTMKSQSPSTCVPSMQPLPLPAHNGNKAHACCTFLVVMAACWKAELPGLIIALPMYCSGPSFDSLAHFTCSTSLL